MQNQAFNASGEELNNITKRSFDDAYALVLKPNNKNESALGIKSIVYYIPEDKKLNTTVLLKRFAVDAIMYVDTTTDLHRHYTIAKELLQ